LKIINTHKKSAGGVGQVVEHLPSKCEAPSSNSSAAQIKKFCTNRGKNYFSALPVEIYIRKLLFYEKEIKEYVPTYIKVSKRTAKLLTKLLFFYICGVDGICQFS
jgi:hypothetical protein